MQRNHNKPLKWGGLLICTIFSSLFLAACNGAANTAVPPPSTVANTVTNNPTISATNPVYPTVAGGYKTSADAKLVGAGASFPNPAYQLWIKSFTDLNPGLKMTYDSVGSGQGRKSFFAGEADFAGSDAYPTDEEKKQYGKDILTIPTVLGAVVLIYNLPGVPELKLSPETIGAIFTGRISKWNDKQVVDENGGIPLPNLPIIIGVRQDSSGTTDVFTRWLAEVFPDFKALNIAGSQPAWEKTGVTVSKAPQNDGVFSVVKQNIGALGYVESTYALSNNTPYASIKNTAGKYVRVNTESVTIPANGNVPDDLQLKLLNSTDPKAYPIVATSWIIIPKEIANKAQAEALVKFLWWITSDSAPLKQTQELNFAPLPPAVTSKVQDTLKRVTSGGQPVLK